LRDGSSTTTITENTQPSAIFKPVNQAFAVWEKRSDRAWSLDVSVEGKKDRVVTVAMFGRLNEIELHNHGDGSQFNRGSFFFQEKQWTQTRMADVMHEVASRSIHCYFSEHGKAALRQ
jgi:hypothetical protein